MKLALRIVVAFAVAFPVGIVLGCLEAAAAFIDASPNNA